MVRNAAGNQIGCRVSRKCHGRQGKVARDTKSYPFHQLTEIVRGRHPFKETSTWNLPPVGRQGSQTTQRRVGMYIDGSTRQEKRNTEHELILPVPHWIQQIKLTEALCLQAESDEKKAEINRTLADSWKSKDPKSQNSLPVLLHYQRQQKPHGLTSH